MEIFFIMAFFIDPTIYACRKEMYMAMDRYISALELLETYIPPEGIKISMLCETGEPAPEAVDYIVLPKNNNIQKPSDAPMLLDVKITQRNGTEQFF